MKIKSDHGVFPDYLSVSYSIDAFPERSIRSVLLDLSFTAHRSVPNALCTPEGHGIVFFDYRTRFCVVRFSGAVLNDIILMSGVGDLLQALTEENYRITRLDLAKDIVVDSVDVVMADLERVWCKARTGRVRLGRKSVDSQKVNRIQSPRRDNAITGTVYVGSRKDRYMARVYDKRAEQWARRGRDIWREVIRYEVSALRNTASLRDFLEPDMLFFYLASPDLLECPPDVPAWRSTPLDPLLLPPVVKLTEHERMIRLIENSPDLDLLRRLIESKPSELPLVLRRIEGKLSSDAGVARVA